MRIGFNTLIGCLNGIQYRPRFVNLDKINIPNFLLFSLRLASGFIVSDKTANSGLLQTNKQKYNRFPGKFKLIVPNIISINRL